MFCGERSVNRPISAKAELNARRKLSKWVAGTLKMMPVVMICVGPWAPSAAAQESVGNPASNGLSDAGAWSTYSPTIVCGTGSVAGYTSQFGRYKRYLGKTIALSVTVLASGIGTCSGSVSVSLPTATQGGTIILYGRSNTTGKGLFAAGSSGPLAVTLYDGSTFVPATDSFSIDGIYESN